jgi:Possible hemagglutinin (DUF637)/DNase/tRNase domain of colicin-like bacteriocin/Pre-toxin domain with VENN motif
MNNVVSTSPSSYRYSPATGGIRRRSRVVARSHVLTHTAKASRVCMGSLTHTVAARPDKHLQASQAAKPIQQAIQAVKQPIYKQNQPVVQVSTAQAATKFIVSIASATGKGKGKVDSSVGQSAPATPTQLKALAAKPGMNWVNDVAAQSAELAKTNPAAALHIQNVQLAHDQWDYKQQGLTKEGAAIVTLVVAYFTAGAASGAGSALAAGVGATGTTAAVVAGATTAALSSLAAQASVSMINNQGNLGAVLNELGSKESVKGLLTAMVTAGALNGLSSAMGGVTATGGTNWSQINATSPFVDQLQKNLVNQLTSNVLQTALTGGNSSDYEKSLQTSLLTAFISTGAAQGANAIGDMQANGSLNALTHKLAHAIAGCAAGAATASVAGGSAGNGCGSGAIGAVIGELTAQAVGGNRSNTDTINLARLLGGVAGALTGGDVNLAAAAGGNAAENNYLNHTDAARLASLKDKQRVGKCDTRCDKEIKALQVKDSTSNRALAACEGVNSSACDSVRQAVRKAAADYIRQGLGDPLTELNPTYNREKSETLQLADATMTGQTQGTVEGLYNGVKDSVVGTATLLSDLFASAFGNTQAQLDLNAEGQGMYNFLKDPDNWPQLLGAMSAQEREQLALAYERGDGKKIGEIGAAALLNMPMAGPAGVIKKIDKIADVAKVGDRVGDVTKGPKAGGANQTGAKPYDPKTARSDLEAVHGEENVASTTVANNPIQRVNSNPDKGVTVIGNGSGKAVQVEFKDPVSGQNRTANIPYDSRGLPVFDDVSQFTTKIDSTVPYEKQFSKATIDLRNEINAGRVDPSQFTTLQLQKIQAGSDKIPGLTWHHNAQSGPNNMQLIPTKIHDEIKHLGQGSLSQGK